MSSNGSYVYYGFWINWSHGRIEGSTITLSERNGGLLTAFLALFVTITGDQLWRILSFVIHQVRASKDPRDGLHHQQQAVFRNSSSPGAAAWTFVQMPVYWWSAATRPLLRSLPWAILALLYLAAFGFAGVFSSAVTKAAGDETLIVSPNCGRLVYDDHLNVTGRGDFVRNVLGRGVIGALAKLRDEVLAADEYARACYTVPLARSQPRCRIYATSQIPYNRHHNVSCPFDAGTCLVSDNAAFRMDTGFIDSHAVLGINTPKKDRLTYRRVTTCAPLNTEGYMRSYNATERLAMVALAGDRMIDYNYGSKLGLSAKDVTLQYNTHARLVTPGYTVQAELALAAAVEANPLVPVSRSSWIPVPQLNRTDADVTLIFVAPNGVRYSTRSDDPFFPAQRLLVEKGISGNNSTYYVPDSYMNVMGCIDQDQICNPSKGACTPLSGSSQLVKGIDQVGLNEVQKRVAERIATIAALNRMYHAVIGRTATALRAHEVLSGRLSGPLEREQWKIEASSWFNLGLAKLQQRIVEYAAGPSAMYPGYHLEQPNDTIGRDMCYTQKMRSTDISISFSVLGMSIILGVGGIVILTNLVLDTVVGFIQHRYLRRGKHGRRQWILNETLQLQRLAFQGAGMGTWSGLTSAIPVTKLGELLSSLDSTEAPTPDMYSGCQEGTATFSRADKADIVAILSANPEYIGVVKDMAASPCETFSDNRRHTFDDRQV